MGNQKDREPFPSFGILPTLLQSWELSQMLSLAKELYQLNMLGKTRTIGRQVKGGRRGIPPSLCLSDLRS